MNLLDVIFTRRSIRSFTPDSIPDEALQRQRLDWIRSSWKWRAKWKNDWVIDNHKEI